MDYKIVGRADSRYLVAGMGVALASWYEFNLSREELEHNRPRQIAYELAGQSRELILDRGKEAVQDVKKGEMSSAIESVIEVNILEAGLIRTLGGTSFQALISHYVAQELIPYTDQETLFGDVVAFGVIIQEMLGGAQVNSFRELLDFYKDVELPLTLDSLGLPKNQRDTILVDATESIAERLTDQPVQFDRDSDSLEEAIRDADELGQTVVQSGVDEAVSE